MSQSTVCILSSMLLVTSEGRGVPQSWRSVDICEDGTLHEQMIVTRDAINQKRTPGIRVRIAMSKYKINPADLEGKSNRNKRNEIKAKIDTFTHNEIMEASSTKSKVKHLIDNEGHKKGIQQRHTERNRNECSAIFATRTRMLGVKNNYRTAHNHQVCRWCKADQETQDHTLKECPNFQCHTEKLDISKKINDG